MKLHVSAMLWLTAFVPLTAHADTVVDQRQIFEGRNVYAPTLLFDSQENIYKMWYGGWQSQSDYPNDSVYYRTSSDGYNWSSPQTVLSPGQVAPDAIHINDPSVTKTMNGVNGEYQYTMFYVNCVAPCNNYSQNQIWSAVSSDGINWQYHQPLITDSQGASTPSAVVDPQSDGTFWKVYYSNTTEDGAQPVTVFLAKIGGNRSVISEDEPVFKFPKLNGGVMANPDVKFVAGSWQLFFNVYNVIPGFRHTTHDIYKVRSSTNMSWSADDVVPLIVNNPAGNVCGTIAPGILPIDSPGQYLIQFGQTPYSGGDCDLSQQSSMQQWIWQD